VERGGLEITSKQNPDTLSSIFMPMGALRTSIPLMLKPWIYLLVASGLEAAWTFSLRKLDLGALKNAIVENPLFSSAVGVQFGYLLLYLGLGGSNIYFLSLSMKSIPMTIAIATWTSVSLILIKMCDIFILKNPTNLSEFFFLALIIIGIVGLKYSAPA
jgi:quaternary ammonium compound-resistance protein SugE